MIQLHHTSETSGRVETIHPPCPAVPATSQVMAVMRLCAPDLGLSPQVLRTLEVLLGCLAPRRNHHVVFASNGTLVSRAGGLSERSIRRHIAQLIAADLAERCDSANGKRYSKHDPLAGLTLRFGLNFAKLFARLDALAALAAENQRREQRLRYLHCKLRAACQKLLKTDPDNQLARATRNIARRKLSAAEYEAALAGLPVLAEAKETPAPTEDLTAAGGQNDRHQSSFSKEHIEEGSEAELSALLDHCSEAQSFAGTRVETADGMIQHAEKLAPMIGISGDLWGRAAEHHRRLDLAALVWMMLQNLDRILKPAAYFRAVTIGKQAGRFAPWQWLRSQTIPRCPRTIA